MRDISRHPSIVQAPSAQHLGPASTSPWAAVGLVLGPAAIRGTIMALIWTASVRSNAWLGHGLATGLLVLAAGMAVGPRRWQRQGINVTAWVMGFCVGLSLMTLFSVGLISLVVVIFLGAALFLWPHAEGDSPFGWTQVWYECFGFLTLLVPLLVLIPSMA